jgi:TetR/AcrR family fatty acid metabolism transcriptional regulator
MRGRKKSDQTRLAIVNGAAEVFSQHDFHEVLTDDIAHRLGIGKGTIYRYFRSKEELYLAAIGEGLSGLRAAVERVTAADSDLRVMVEGLTGTLISYFWRRRDFFVLLHRLEAKLSEQERVDWQKSRDEVVALVTRRLDQAAERGEIAAINSRLAVEALFGMIRGVCVYRAERDRPGELTQLVTEIFLHGLTKAEQSARKLKVVRGGKPRS